MFSLVRSAEPMVVQVYVTSLCLPVKANASVATYHTVRSSTNTTCVLAPKAEENTGEVGSLLSPLSNLSREGVA
jgi:hypothetical protein